MLKIITQLAVASSLIVILVILNITTPVTAGPFGILTVFVSAYVALIVLFTYGLHWASRALGRLSMAFVASKPFGIISIKRSYYFSTVLAAAPIMLIGLQSVSSVGLGELALVTLFIAIGCLYVSKRVN